VLPSSTPFTVDPLPFEGHQIVSDRPNMAVTYPQHFIFYVCVNKASEDKVSTDKMFLDKWSKFKMTVDKMLFHKMSVIKMIVHIIACYL
jgi:hypothetical protein